MKKKEHTPLSPLKRGMFKVSYYNIGCKVNYAEISSIVQEFIDNGAELVAFGEECDLILINTCTVTHLADSDCRNIIRRTKRNVPNAKIAVMGGTQAAKVLTQIQVSALKKKGEAPDKNSEQALFDEIKSRYDRQTSPYYAAARLWVDAIIDPRKTRDVISIGIEMADHGIVEKFNPGILQT